MPRLLVALLAVAALLAAASAFAQGLSREEALQALKRPDTAARRLAAQSLGAAGRMADVPALLGLLRDRDDEARTLAEQSIWAIWGRSGDARVDQLYEEGVKQMQSGLAVEAIATFSRIVELKPEFAEGWNKRATAYYMAGDYKKSLADCHEVLKRNANHFGALSGYGLIYIQLEDYELALEYFRRALAINPNLEGISNSIQGLERLIDERRRKLI
jgi:tetratricopeptide (TPR) repeat protein